MFTIRNLIDMLHEKPPPKAMQPGRAANASALVAALIACGGPLLGGLFGAWSWTRIVVYAVLTVLYFVLLMVCLQSPARIRWTNQPLWVYLLLTGIVAVGLQAISGDNAVQPIVFTIPFVQAGLAYAPWRVLLAGAGYLGGMALGLRLGGNNDVLNAVATYGALMGFMFAFVRLSIEQSRARADADTLADELVHERDNFARLAALTATLTRDLDVNTVLEEVAAAGQQLTHAQHARVWLHDAANNQPESALLIEPERVVLPLFFKGAAIGVLDLHASADAPFSREHIRLLQPLADAAAVAITNARLFAQLQHTATLAERNRLARELHDTIAQGLTAVTMQLEAAQRSFDRDAARTRTRLTRAHELARQALDDVRRSVWTLAEPLVEERDLEHALDELGQNFAARTGIAVDYTHSGPPATIGSAAATQVVRIMREVLQNVEKHARATSVSYASATDDGALRIVVRDDGIGFAPNGSNEHGAGFGLLSLHERARLAGGTIVVDSTLGAGTQITLTIPRQPQPESQVV